MQPITPIKVSEALLVAPAASEVMSRMSGGPVVPFLVAFSTTTTTSLMTRERDRSHVRPSTDGNPSLRDPVHPVTFKSIKDLYRVLDLSSLSPQREKVLVRDGTYPVGPFHPRMMKTGTVKTKKAAVAAAAAAVAPAADAVASAAVAAAASALAACSVQGDKYFPRPQKLNTGSLYA